MVYEFELIEQVMDEPTGMSIAQLREVLSALPAQGFFRLLTAMVQTGKVTLLGEDGGSLVAWRASDLLRSGELSEMVRVMATSHGIRMVFPDDLP